MVVSPSCADGAWQGVVLVCACVHSGSRRSNKAPGNCKVTKVMD